MALDTRLPVRDSLREVNDESWIVADKLLLSRQSSKSPGCTWSDGQGSFYVLSDVNGLPPASRPLCPTSPFLLVYDAGDAHAVWKIGDAFLKVIIPASPYVTREHVTLNALHSMEPELSFAIPNVLNHSEWDGRYYLVLSQLPGQTLSKAWPNMDETTKTECVCRVTDLCKELASRHGTKIGGVDGSHLPEHYLTTRSSPEQANVEFNPEILLRNCQELKMGCFTFEFYHCDLGPGNIIVDFANGQLVVGVIDWECAGFVPREWIRTKFRICSGMDFDLPAGDESRSDWRKRMQRRLGEEGFPEIAQRWMAWRGLE